MHLKHPFNYALFLAAFLLFTGLHARAADSAQADAFLQKLLSAELTRNFEAFTVDGTDELKAALTKPQFDASCAMLSSKLGAGYTIAPLGDLNRHDGHVWLYALRFKDGGDDVLATLTVQNGKVAGIYFK